MRKFILIYFNPAALGCVAQEAANEAPDLVVTSEQVTRYAGFLTQNAYKISNRVVMKIECEELPRPYSIYAEDIFESDDKGNVRSFKNKRPTKGNHEIAYEADLVKYPYMRIASAIATPVYQPSSAPVNGKM